MADGLRIPAGEAVPNVTPRPRNLVLMLDGTSNQFSEHNSNLIKLMSVVKADEAQLLFYSSGVGTILPDSASTWGVVKQKTAAAIDLALAWNFKQFVQDGYTWLMDNYQDGDKIYLFGFSRGAYTARALAGMIQRVGLLNPGNHNQVSPAYQLYTSRVKWKGKDGEPKDPAVLYRRIFGRSRPVTVEFLGVWDTVSSLGGIDLPELPFASGARSVKFFRHALALDERRARFVPEYWRMDEDEAVLRKAIAKFLDASPGSPKAVAAKHAIAELTATLDDHYPTSASVVQSDGTTKVLRKHAEVWFMGCHSDVGGGNDVNDEPSLSNIPFRWMLREAVQVGLVLNPSGFALQSALDLPSTLVLKTPMAPQTPQGQSALPPDHAAGTATPSDPRLLALKSLAEILKPQVDDAKKDIESWAACKPYIAELPQSVLVEMVEEAAKLDSYPDGPGVAPARAGAFGTRLSADALMPYSESLTAVWRPLEALPLATRVWKPDGRQKKNVVRMNKGRGRQIIPKQKLHRSVGLRMVHDAEKAKEDLAWKHAYSPHAHVADDWPEWNSIAQGKEWYNDFWEE